MHEARPDALRLHLWPKQWTAFLTEATEVLFGGAAGPGKSHLMRIAAILWCAEIPGLQVYLFRRIREDLYKNHMDGPKGFRAVLAMWVISGWCRIAGDEIRFWNGSTIYLCHCKNEKDVYQYQGAEIHVLMIDELTHFSEKMYRFLRGRVRKVGIKLPEKYEGRFPRILCGSNPGNIGHLWVKTSFISGSVPFEVRRMPQSEGGMLRQFIPGRLEDNPSMTEDDPEYEGRLSGLGSSTLVKAMRDGDWDVVEGAFFSEWSNQQHVLTPFAIPSHWLRFRSGDWGSASPYSIGWWAVVGDDYSIAGKSGMPERAAALQSVALPDASGHEGVGDRRLRPIQAGRPDLSGGSHSRSRILPRGALVRYREDYGKVGAKLTAEAVGARIAKLEADDPKMAFGVLDPRCFAEDGGPSIAERVNDELIKKKLIAFHKADNKRTPKAGSNDSGGPIAGWDQMRARLIGTARKDEHFNVDWATGRPMIYCFLTCVDSIRTIPVLQHDMHRAEDLNTKSEDHCADEWRYACMSRPWTKSLPKGEAVKRDSYREARGDRHEDTTATL